jgi:hypothetical protein
VARPKKDDGYIPIAHELHRAIALANFSKWANVILAEVLFQVFNGGLEIAMVSPSRVARDYGVSDATVRRAFKELVDSGVLLKAKEGAVSFNKDYDAWVRDGSPRLTTKEREKCILGPLEVGEFLRGSYCRDRSASATPTVAQALRDRSASATPTVAQALRDRSASATPTVAQALRDRSASATPTVAQALRSHISEAPARLETKETQGDRGDIGDAPHSPQGGGAGGGDETTPATITARPIADPEPIKPKAPKYLVDPADAEEVANLTAEVLDPCHAAAAKRALRDYPLAWVIEMVESFRNPDRGQCHVKGWKYYESILIRYAKNGGSDLEIARREAEAQAQAEAIPFAASPSPGLPVPRRRAAGTYGQFGKPEFVLRQEAKREDRERQLAAFDDTSDLQDK